MRRKGAKPGVVETKEEDPTKPSKFSVFIGPVSVALVLVAVAFTISIQKPAAKIVPVSHRSHNESFFGRLKPVERLEWAPNRPFIDMLLKRKTPIVLTNTVVSQWTALQKWTPEYLRDHVKMLKNVKNGTDPEFVLEGNHKPLKFRNYEPKRYQTVNVTSDSFFSQTSHTETHPYFLYYAGGVDDMAAGLSNDLERMKDFFVQDPELAAHNFWIAPAGVRTRIHHDRAENLFVQVYGKKRWRIFPPSAWKELYLYPYMHPRYQQSQVDFTDLDAAVKFPNVVDLEGYEVELGPGDLLYNPPYWFHEVTSMDFCISLSFLNPSQEEVLYNEAFWERLPIKQEWDAEEKALAARLYLTTLLKRIDSTLTLADFFKQVFLDNRFKNFLPQIHTIAPGHTDYEKHRCYAKSPIRAVMQRKADMFETPAANAAAALLRLSPAIRYIGLANLAEELATWAVGPDNTILFFEYCG